MQVNKAEFLEVLRRSKVVAVDRVQQLADDPESDAARIANRLVREKALTEWQAKYLLSGRHQLEIGPYRLLERIQRDDVGDRFSAIHEQLGRHVDLQVISSVLSKDEKRYQAFIERVGKAATIDHPHLIHVYDVDKAGGRYYLVTEHVEGHDLTEVKPGTLGLATAMNWFGQAVTGLRHAHANGLVHGDLKSEDLIVDQESGLKIRNLAMAGMRTPAGLNRSPMAIDDWKTLGSIFCDLLNQSSSQKLESSPEVAECLRLLGELKNAKDLREIDLIEGQIANVVSGLAPEAPASSWGVRLDRLEDLEMDPYESTLEPDYVAQGYQVGKKSGTSTSADTKPNSRSKVNQGTSGASRENAIERWFANLALTNPVGLLSSAFVIGLLAAGTLTYFSLGTFSSRTVAQASQGETAVGSQSSNTKTLVSTSLKKDSQDPANSNRLDQPDSLAQVEKIEQTKQPANPAPVSPTPDQTNNNAAAQPTPQTSPQPAGTAENALPVIENTPSAAPQPAQPTTAVAESTPAPPVAPAAMVDEELLKKMAQPFAQLPSQLSLPAIDDNVEAKLGEVFIADRFLLGAEIIVSEGISNSKVHFEMERDPADNQRWLINLSRTPKDRKTPIAVIRRDAQDLFFQWLPEAKSNRQSGFLKNCFLKLFVPEQSVSIALRTPVVIPPLVLQPDELTTETSFELDFMPKAENVLVELLPVDIDETRLSPSVIDLGAGIPGRILLKREDDNAMVWVNFALELKAKARLRSDLVFVDVNGPRPLKNLKELQTVAAQWKTQEFGLTKKAEVAESTPAPYGKADEKKIFVDTIIKQRNFAGVQATKFQQYVEAAPKMMGQPFGIRIVARFEGFEVELAKTKIDKPAAASDK